MHPVSRTLFSRNRQTVLMRFRGPTFVPVFVFKTIARGPHFWDHARRKKGPSFGLVFYTRFGHKRTPTITIKTASAIMMTTPITTTIRTITTPVATQTKSNSINSNGKNNNNNNKNTNNNSVVVERGGGPLKS